MTDAILTQQKELAEKIEKLNINFKKDGPSRKTREYLNTRKELLTQLWGQFQRAHNELSTKLNEDHLYFSQQLYEKTREI
jgi:HD-like signal output (HDOD) protein